MNRNIQINNTSGEIVLVNWDNVTHACNQESYTEGLVGDTGPNLEINFVNKQHISTKETIKMIEGKLNGR